MISIILIACSILAVILAIASVTEALCLLSGLPEAYQEAHGGHTGGSQKGPKEVAEGLLKRT